MKKTALSVAFVLALLILGTFIIGTANSAPTYPIPTGPLTPPVISLQSPTSTTYVSWFVPFQLSVNGSWDGFVNHCIVKFSLDENMPYVIYDPPVRINKIYQNFSITLGPLSEGMHNLQVFATVGGIYRTGPNETTVDSNDFTSQTSVYFKVNTANQAQIVIISPLNETYNFDKMIPLEFTVNKTSSIVSMGYTLDEQSNVTIPRNTTLYGPISDGVHTLKVYSTFSDILPVSSTINFTVDTTPPNVLILSLQNKLYNSSNIPLVFTVNETTSQITYIMDKKVYTIYGNTTLTSLQDGDHTLTVYATDEAGNAGASKTIDFTVQVPLPPQIALPILPPMAIVLIGGLSLLIYSKKRNHTKAKNIEVEERII
jgi:Bacterial Ig-like domain